MPRCQPKTRTRRKGDALLALLVATGAATLAQPLPLAAQDLGLRGEVAETTVLLNPARDRLATGSIADGGTQQDIASTPAYVPISPGAVPDQTDAGGGTGDADDPFADSPPDGFAARPAPAERSVSTAQAASPAGDDATGPGTSRAAATPPTDDEATDASAEANRRIRTLDSEDRQPLDPGADRTGAIEGAAPKADDDPFAPVGIQAGTFVLRPSIEQGITASSNADSAPGGRSGVLSETTLRLNATSDWALNSATIDAYGTYRKSLSGQDIHDLRGRVDGTLNLDLDSDWRATATLGYEASPESASSPVVIQNTTSRPLHQAIDGSLGIEKDIGKARLGLTGMVERDLYGDADLQGGGTLSQKDRNATLYTARLRGGYEISPALTPFAEVEIGRRVYDEHADAGGYERSADRLGFRAGAEVDLGEKLNGEVSAGWIREAPDDVRLPAIQGASVDANLKWSPERGTTVGLNGTTTVEGTTTPGESGSILYSGRLSVDRQIRADLTANATLGADWRDYSGSGGHDRILSAEAGLTWWLNRFAGITTRARYEKQTSNLPGRDYDATSVFLGLKVQR
jgi:hypothetical protein